MANQFPSFSSIACSLTSVMNQENGKSRGNLGRLVLAVHTVFLRSGFVTISTGETSIFIGDRSPPSLLRYFPYASRIAGNNTVVVKFSAEEDSVTVSGSLSPGGVDDDDSNFHRVSFDLSRLSGPLIACLHGAIGDSEERVIVEFWREVGSRICEPLRTEFALAFPPPTVPFFAPEQRILPLPSLIPVPVQVQFFASASQARPSLVPPFFPIFSPPR